MSTVVDEFHRVFHKETVWMRAFWRGVQALKCPFDLWLYQEIIVRTKPDIIIECGTCYGGTALFLADICQLLNHGRVITIDREPVAEPPRHSRLTFVVGSSVAPEIVAAVDRRPEDRIMVILDSDHSATHVYQELCLWSPLVAVGCYLIVEDTNLNGNPVDASDADGGPMAAVKKFLQHQTNFQIDPNCHKFLLTFNPDGYLVRQA
jgi:cephalosporin hydroxylase